MTTSVPLTPVVTPPLACARLPTQISLAKQKRGGLSSSLGPTPGSVLGTFLNLSEPRFPHLYDGDENHSICLRGLLQVPGTEERTPTTETIVIHLKGW